MAGSFLFDYGREGFLAGSISWTGDNIRVALVDTAAWDQDSTSNAQFYDAIPVLDKVAESSNLAGKTAGDGIANADDVTYTTVAADDPCEALIIYKWVTD